MREYNLISSRDRVLLIGKYTDELHEELLDHGCVVTRLDDFDEDVDVDEDIRVIIAHDLIHNKQSPRDIIKKLAEHKPRLLVLDIIMEDSTSYRINRYEFGCRPSIGYIRRTFSGIGYDYQYCTDVKHMEDSQVRAMVFAQATPIAMSELEPL